MVFHSKSDFRVSIIKKSVFTIDKLLQTLHSQRFSAKQ